MINKADIEGKTRYTNAGPEQSLANQLKNLALNKKKMALFTPEEQEAIIDAGKVVQLKTLQNLLVSLHHQVLLVARSIQCLLVHSLNMQYQPLQLLHL
jgi:uncharacterized protein (UPF0371 family)